MSFFKEAVVRIKSETPIWFRRLGNGSVSAGVAGLGMITMQAGLNAITPQGTVPPHVPDFISTIGSHLMVAGAIGKIFSAFACTNTPTPTQP